MKQAYEKKQQGIFLNQFQLDSVAQPIRLWSTAYLGSQTL